MSFQIKYVYDLVDKISPQLKTIQTNLQTTAAKVSQSATSMASSFEKVGQKIQSVGKKSLDTGKNLFLKTTLPITLLGGSFIKAASDYQESLNKVDVAFGKSSESVKNFAMSAGENFGIDRGRALDMAAMFGDMSTSMGLSQEKAGTLSTSLVGLSGDLASFKNIGVDQAQTALAGIFTGETESLKRLGIVMTETNLQQFALTQGINKKIEKMKQDEKVLLRYNYIMAMSKNSLGDFARTQEGFANQSRILGSRFKDLSITLGSILLPYAIKLVNVVIGLIEKFQNLSPTTQKIVLILAGLAAILPPLLIGLGMMAMSITAIGTVFAAISLPILGITAGIVALAAAAYLCRDSFVVVYDFLKDQFLAVFDAIIAKIDQAVAAFNKFRTDASSVLSFVGLDSLANSVAPNSAINQAAPINTPQQSFAAGGQLDINLRGLPKGSNSNFTPVPKNFMNVGVNSVYEGAY